MSTISTLAQIDPKAHLADDVEVGPFCCIGPGVVLEKGCRLRNHVTIIGPTRIGPNNEFFPGCVIGADPQDLKYRGEPTELHIGSGNVFRELVTAHRGTEVGGGVTRIGNDNRILVGVHIAHDCQIGNACVFANNVQFAGHCHVEDCVNIGGIAGIHHFVTIGRHAFIAGAAKVTIDVPPFVLAAGHDLRIRSLNTEGLKRWGFTPMQIANLRAAYRVLFSKGAAASKQPLDERIAGLRQTEHFDDNVEDLCEHVRRSTLEGVYGRYLESRRQDTPEDRRRYQERILAERASRNGNHEDE